jgi:hypothetical protein
VEVVQYNKFLKIPLYFLIFLIFNVGHSYLKIGNLELHCQIRSNITSTINFKKS